jgi:hypothetical protein
MENLEYHYMTHSFGENILGKEDIAHVKDNHKCQDPNRYMIAVARCFSILMPYSPTQSILLNVKTQHVLPTPFQLNSRIKIPSSTIFFHLSIPRAQWQDACFPIDDYYPVLYGTT